MLVASPPKVRSKWRRWVAVIFLTTLLVAVGGEVAIGLVFRARLAAAVKKSMHADLTVGFAWYLPPYGVSLHHLRLTRLKPDGTRVETFYASRILLKLGDFPRHGKPFIVKAFEIDSPSIATLPALSIDAVSGSFRVDDDTAVSAVHVDLGQFTAKSGMSELNFDGGTFSTNGQTRTWDLADLRGRIDLYGDVKSLENVHMKGRFVFSGFARGSMELPKDATLLTVIDHELLVYPRDVSIQPPKFPITLDHINGGPIDFRGDLIRFENINANYGGDQVLLDEAHITLDDSRQQIEIHDFQEQIKIDGISGTLVCQQPGPQYPAALGKIIAQLRPSGAFSVGGGSWYAINRKLPQLAKPKPDYFFRISTAGGGFALTEHKIPLTNIHADARVSPMLVEIPKLRAETLGGTIIASTKITPEKPVVYQGTATLYNINLETTSRAFGADLKKPLIGKMYLKISASGMGPGGDRTPLQSFFADGEFQVADGNFGNVDTVRAATAHVTKNNQPLDGMAAGLFTIRDETITLNNAVVGNPYFGLQGDGTIGFDKSLNLMACAAPLGDWRSDMKRTDVPIVADVGGDIAGAVQHLFDGAQRSLLWEVHITGSTTAPRIQEVTAPALSQSAAMLFGQLRRGSKDNELIDQMRKKPG